MRRREGASWIAKTSSTQWASGSQKPSASAMTSVRGTEKPSLAKSTASRCTTRLASSIMRTTSASASKAMPLKKGTAFGIALEWNML